MGTVRGRVIQGGTRSVMDTEGQLVLETKSGRDSRLGLGVQEVLSPDPWTYKLVEGFTTHSRSVHTTCGGGREGT